MEQIFFQLQLKAAISYHLYRQFNNFWTKIFHRAIKKTKKRPFISKKTFIQQNTFNGYGILVLGPTMLTNYHKEDQEVDSE
jgi:hypothetical protein